MSAGQLAPVLLARATRFRLLGRVHFPRDCIGDVRSESDDDYVVFRKLILDPTAAQPAEPGAVFKVRFRFANLSPRINKRLSLIPAPFIAAQPGFRSKTWMLGRNTEMFQGLYEWDSVAEAEAYTSSFPLRLMEKRAIPGSVSYEVAPK